MLYDLKVKVLVTGGAGFIGSHLVENFESNDHQVTVLDSFKTGSKANLDLIDFSGNLVQGDIRDAKLVEPLISESDLVIHLAAAVGVSNIMNSTIESISTNILGSEVILNLAAKYKRRIFIASTSEIYGKNPKQPLNEEDDRVVGTPQNIRWSYSDAKAIEEAMATSLFLNSNLPVTTVRFFNTVGPRQSSMYGMVVPRFVKQAIEGSDITVFGDGSQSRVFCHVLDAISGIESLFNTEKSVGQVFNIGGVGEITIIELARLVIETLNSNSKIKYVDPKSIYPNGFEDMQRRVPDTTKINRLTGWKPTRNLSEIILDVARVQKLN